MASQVSRDQLRAARRAERQCAACKGIVETTLGDRIGRSERPVKGKVGFFSYRVAQRAKSLQVNTARMTVALAGQGCEIFHKVVASPLRLMCSSGELDADVLA